MVFKQEVNVPLLITIGIISAVLLLVATFGVQAWYANAEQTEEAIKAEDAPASDYVQLRQSQATALNQFGWADKSKGIVRIPIDDAMRIIVQNNGALPSTQPSGAAR